MHAHDQTEPRSDESLLSERQKFYRFFTFITHDLYSCISLAKIYEDKYRVDQEKDLLAEISLLDHAAWLYQHALKMSMLPRVKLPVGSVTAVQGRELIRKIEDLLKEQSSFAAYALAEYYYSTSNDELENKYLNLALKWGSSEAVHHLAVMETNQKEEKSLYQQAECLGSNYAVFLRLKKQKNVKAIEEVSNKKFMTIAWAVLVRDVYQNEGCLEKAIFYLKRMMLFGSVAAKECYQSIVERNQFDSDSFNDKFFKNSEIMISHQYFLNAHVNFVISNWDKMQEVINSDAWNELARTDDFFIIEEMRRVLDSELSSSCKQHIITYFACVVLWKNPFASCSEHILKLCGGIRDDDASLLAQSVSSLIDTSEKEDKKIVNSKLDTEYAVMRFFAPSPALQSIGFFSNVKNIFKRAPTQMTKSDPIKFDTPLFI